MPKLAEIFTFLKFVGIKNSLRTIRYTLYRDWLNWRYPRKILHRQSEAAGEIVSCHPTGNNSLEIRFTNFNLEIQFLAPALARIRWTRHSDIGLSPVPYAIAKSEWSPVDIQRKPTSDGELFSSADMQIHLSAKGELAFMNPDGQIVHQDKSPQLIHRGWLLQSSLAPEECIYGLGEQADGLNLRGSAHRLYNTDAGGSYGLNEDPLYFPFPVYIGMNRHGGYLVFHENTYPGTITIDPQTAFKSTDYSSPAIQGDSLIHVEFESPSIQYYFIIGDPDKLLDLYTELTGRPFLPPLWSLGYHQSRWGYLNEREIREVVAGFAEHKMQLSAIHLDIDYMDGYRVFTVDQERYPQLSKLAEDLIESNIRLVVILDPGVKIDPNYEIYQQGIREGMFCTLPGGKLARGLVWPGWSAYPDFTNPEVRRWWGAKYQALLDQGVSGFWHDMNEPTSFSSWGGMYLPDATQHNLEGHTGDNRVAHNIYALQMNRAGYEALQQSALEKRPWQVPRSGWAGNQRYAWNWTGDTESTWVSLRMTVATILGLGLSGIPFTGSDIGGFSGTPSPELYLRWFQLASFMPFFRTHSAVATPPREPWVFGEPYKSIHRDFLRLRYSLLPFLYTLAWEASQSGAPLVRPLFWSHPKNQEYWQIEDQFFLGDALLVAPILEASCREREVVFPPGYWVSFWEDKDWVAGPCTISVDTNQQTIPLYVRSGSVLPLNVNEELALHVYLPALNPQKDVQYQGFGQLYSDQGDGYGPSRLDQFHLVQTGSMLEISWKTSSTSNGAIYPLPYENVIIHLHGSLPQKLWADGLTTSHSGNKIKLKPFKKLLIQLAHEKL